ncbi:NosD domain-containing protein [Azorhizophilus paspali]
MRTGEYVAIDGFDYIKGDGALACPGANPGEFGTNVRTSTLPGLTLRDTHSVRISGLEVRNFCIGILINRASNNLIQDNRIVANKGGAGIMLTGDDGQGNPTSTTTNNNKVLRNQLIDNGDGLELTRGAAFNLIADNLFLSTPLNPEPSQGIEILWGNDNTVVRNRFENYSDGLQINWGKRNYLGANEFTGNSIGINLSGDSNVADGNLIYGNRIGIALRPEANLTTTRLSANRIWNNGQDIRRCEAGGSCVAGQRTGAIVFGVPALEHADFVGSRGKGDNPNPGKRHKICVPGAIVDDCQPMPNRNQQPPLLTGIEVTEGQRLLVGELHGEANGNYRLEIFGNRAANSNEAEEYLGALYVPTDAQGLARFTFPVADHSLQSLTATATTSDGATSELSAALSLR